jgi:GT2 family glycosyltransferase
MMTPWNEWRQKVLVRLHERRAPLVSAWVERATRRARFVDWVSGACLLVRRRDALAVGGFDERYFLYAEDVDFCAALRALGRQVRFFPGAEVVHLRGRSGRQRPEATERAYRRSHLAFYEKHHPRLAPLLHAYLRARGRHPGSDR